MRRKEGVWEEGEGRTAAAVTALRYAGRIVNAQSLAFFTAFTSSL